MYIIIDMEKHSLIGKVGQDTIGSVDIVKFVDSLGLYSAEVTLRYFISEEELTEEEYREQHLLNIVGAVRTDITPVYGSELTGHMFDRKEFKIGGHDLKKELESHRGKYCFFEMSIKR